MEQSTLKEVSQSPAGMASDSNVRNVSTQFQRLKVEDALSYLDQVKLKFDDQPQVYNDFRDIVKKFKSQRLDTPEVITRISDLFHDHAELIVGFKIFLPRGYKIEVQANEHGQACQVTITMPSESPSEDPQKPESIQRTIFQAATPEILGQVPDGNADTPILSQPPDFNQVINYVNKIKNRFQSQPDKYKKFLEILHAYQKQERNKKYDGKLIETETECYRQISELFENQEDLLAGFSQYFCDLKI